MFLIATVSSRSSTVRAGTDSTIPLRSTKTRRPPPFTITSVMSGWTNRSWIGLRNGRIRSRLLTTLDSTTTRSRSLRQRHHAGPSGTRALLIRLRVLPFRRTRRGHERSFVLGPPFAILLVLLLEPLDESIQDIGGRLADEVGVGEQLLVVLLVQLGDVPDQLRASCSGRNQWHTRSPWAIGKRSAARLPGE